MEISWAFFRKAAAALFVVALLTGFGSTALAMGHRVPWESWRLMFILSLVVLTIASTILVPGLLLPRKRNPHPEFLSDDLADEWRDLQERRIDRPHVLMLAAGLAGLVYLWCVLYYGKMTNAVWFGWLPVGVAAMALALLLFAFARRTPWYHDRFFRTPNRVILIAFVAFGLALVLGIVMTEQPVAPSPGQGLVASEEIVLAVVLVAGAALVPHMWVLSGLVLLTLIALLALHEVRRDRSLIERRRNAAQGERASP